ncbi:MAG: SDR family NAD(P)-dependent oxidoreductase [Clostridiales bacterium]|nr:SDR family NAD(P)-dependent oxidoreductase [Clostridiales bacterium]
MKKALVVGGSNGMGLAVTSTLIGRGYQVIVLDRNEGDLDKLNEGSYTYTYCDLLDFNEELFNDLSLDKDIEVLFISAGVGRIADFKAHHIAEIDKMFTIDTTSALKILRIFYDRIMARDTFYTGVMGSISGWMSSPAASVYAGAKAGLVRTIESINIELESEGTANRILDVSPASFKGSKFNGGVNDLTATTPLAEEIIEHLMNQDTLFIPQYEETFKGVLERYHNDPHEYGLHSYQYKKDSGRMDNGKKVIIGYLAGTFDLFHVGHLNILRRAKQHCDYLIVGVHDSGAWKGKETFIPLDERKAIVASCKYVDKVVDSCREDSDAWDLYHYDRLFVGSDYKGTERFNRYEEYFKDKDVEIVYFPYTQGTSSTRIRDAIISKTK